MREDHPNIYKCLQVSSVRSKIPITQDKQPVTMTYLYESLSPERFQHFCQALLVSSFPNAQCLPVGQPDGGRDAFEWQATAVGAQGRNLFVFQVKFGRSAIERDESFIADVCKSEGPKIEQLIKKGAKAYYLLTTSLLPPYYLLTTSLLPPYYLLTTSLLPPYYLLTTSLLPPYYLLTTSLLPPYYLLTDIQGTAHPDVGSIDRMHAALSDCFGLPAYC